MAPGLGRLDRRDVVLDAVVALRARLGSVAAQLTSGNDVEARIVACGRAGIRSWLAGSSGGWRDIVGVQVRGTVHELRQDLPTARQRRSDGLRVRVVFDRSGLDPEAALLLSGEEQDAYRSGFAPLAAAIVDSRMVLSHGPQRGPEPTLMVAHSAGIVSAARVYLRAVWGSAKPLSDIVLKLPDVTERQRQVIAMLSVDTGDEQVAKALGVSLRTVRADVAALERAFGVRSRFALGRAIQATLDRAYVDATDSRVSQGRPWHEALWSDGPVPPAGSCKSVASTVWPPGSSA